jgi:arylsulfatase A-like enzyme
MTWRGYLIAAVSGIAMLAALAYANRRQLILYYVTKIAANVTEVGPNVAVKWRTPENVFAGNKDARLPNIVVILADDLGYNDITLNGGGFAGGTVPTPNIDALANRGANFKRAYAGTAACAPSRAMLMTGRYSTRTGYEFTPTPKGMGRIIELFYNDGTRPHPALMDFAAADNAPDYKDQGLPSSEITLAEVLKTRGYHTVHIGKWHLGNAPQFAPNAQGFDETLMMESGLYLPADEPGVVNAKLPFDPIDQFLWARMQYAASYNGGNWFAPKGYLTDYYTDEAVNVIRANKERPFFLYLAHWGVHTPLQASKADYEALSHIKDHDARVYGAMIRALDRSVGRVTAELSAQGLLENTIIVFSSDNGGAGYVGLPDVNKPFRGWKLTYFEGGLRVPMLVSWPAKIMPGAEIAAPVGHQDVLPTLAAAAGADLPTDRVIDGIDMMPFLSAPAAGVASSRTMFWRNGDYRVVLSGGWKLQLSKRPDRIWLFDLDADPFERNDLFASRPDKVSELMALIEAQKAQERSPLFPAVGELPILIDKTLKEGGSPSDEYIYWAG